MLDIADHFQCLHAPAIDATGRELSAEFGLDTATPVAAPQHQPAVLPYNSDTSPPIPQQATEGNVTVAAAASWGPARSALSADKPPSSTAPTQRVMPFEFDMSSCASKDAQRTTDKKIHAPNPDESSRASKHTQQIAEKPIHPAWARGTSKVHLLAQAILQKPSVVYAPGEGCQLCRRKGYECILGETSRCCVRCVLAHSVCKRGPPAEEEPQKNARAQLHRPPPTGPLQEKTCKVAPFQDKSPSRRRGASLSSEETIENNTSPQRQLPFVHTSLACRKRAKRPVISTAMATAVKRQRRNPQSIETTLVDQNALGHLSDEHEAEWGNRNWGNA